MAELCFLYLLIILVIFLFISPPLPSIFLYCCSLYSYISLILFDFGFFVPFSMGKYAIEGNILIPIYIFSSSSLLFLLGQRLLFKNKKLELNKKENKKISMYKNNFFAVFSLFTVFVVIQSTGLDNLIYRQGYVIENADLSFRKIADVMIWISIITLPLIKNKLLMRISFILLFLSFLGLGSRSAMVVLFSYPIINYFINRGGRLKLVLMLFVATIFSLAILDVRSDTFQGIIPIFNKIIELDLNLDTLVFLINYISSYSILLFSDYLDSYIISYHYYYMSLNPLPGTFLDIAGIDSWARFRKNIPHSAFSQMYVHSGAISIMIFFFLHGLLCGYIKNRINKTFISIKLKMSMFILCDFLFIVPIVRAMQYNLRTASRLEYMIILVGLVLVFIMYIYRLRSKRKNENTLYNNKF